MHQGKAKPFPNTDHDKDCGALLYLHVLDIDQFTIYFSLDRRLLGTHVVQLLKLTTPFHSQELQHFPTLLK